MKMKSLIVLAIILISLNTFASEIFSNDKKGIWITPKAIPQNQIIIKSGDDFIFEGDICVVKWGGEDHHQKCLKVPASKLVFKAYFPDSLHDVSDKLVVTQSNDKKSWKYSLKTDQLKVTDLNQLTLTVGTGDKKTNDLLKIKAKLEKRIQILRNFKAEYDEKREDKKSYKENLNYITKLIAYLESLDAKIDIALQNNPEILAQIRQPLQVDNIVSAPFYYSSNFSGHKLTLSIPVGVPFEGEKSNLQASVTNLSDKSFYFPEFEDEKDDYDNNDHEKEPDGKQSYRLALDIDGHSLISTVPFDLNFGETKTISVLTGKLNPKSINKITANLEKSSVEHFEHYSFHKRRLGSLSYDLPVVEDNIAPVFLNFKPQADTYHNIRPQLEVMLADSLGRVDPDTINVNLKGTTFDLTSVDRDITNLFSITTKDRGPTYLLVGNVSDLAEGDYEITYKGADFAGNGVTSVLKTIHYDVTAPTVNVYSLGNILTNLKQYHLNFTVLDKSPISYEVLQNGKLIAQRSNLMFDEMITLEEGVNTFEIKAVDAAGNLAVPAVIGNIELDTIAPILTVKPDDGIIFNKVTVPISGTSNESLKTMTVNGKALAIAANKKDFSDNINLEREGDHEIVFTGYDLAGNMSKITRNVKVVLSIFNRNLISIEPTSNGSQLLIKGAPAAVRAGVDVKASAGFFNSKTVTSGSDGSFSIVLNPFSTVTISGTDYSIDRSESFDLSYVVDTSLAGIIKDVDGTSLPGVKVSILGTSQSTTTAADGTFKITNPATGDQKVLIDGTTISNTLFNGQKKFSSIVYSVSIGITQSNVIERPIYLAPIMQDGSETQIQNGASAVVTSSHAAGVELDIPSNAVTFPDGTNTGAISMMTVSADRTTIEPPAFVKPNTVYALEPSGTKFSKPVQLTLPNINQFPEGMELVILSKNSATGEWELDGVAKVGTGGYEIVTKPGMGITHFSEVYAAPLGPEVKDVGAMDVPGANTFSGAYTASIKMPSFKSLGQTVTPELIYQSSWAHPNIVVKNIFDIPRQEITRTSSGRIVTQGVAIDFQQDIISWLEPEFIEAQFFTTNLIGQKIRYTGIPRKAVVSYGMDLSALRSGVHPYVANYGIQLKDMYISTQKSKATILGDAQFENGSKTLIQSKVSSGELLRSIYPTDLRAPLYIQNKKNSEAGAGWKIKGVQKLINPNDNRILIENADGSISTYTVENKISTLLKDSTGIKTADFNTWPNISILNKSNQIKKLDLSSFTSVNASNIPSINSIPGFSGKFMSSHGVMKITGYNPNVGEISSLTCNYKKFPYVNERDISGIMRSQDEGYYGINSLGEFIYSKNSAATRLVGKSNPNILAIRTYSGATPFTHEDSIYFCNSTPGLICQSPIDVATITENGITGYSAGCFANYPDFGEGDWVYSGFADGAIGSAALNKPSSVIYNSVRGSFVIADFGNHRVREVNLATGVVSTIAGSGRTSNSGDGASASSAGLYHPRGVAYDGNGNLYVSTEDGYIRKIDNTGIISTIAGLPISLGGSLEEITTSGKVALNNPYGMIIDNVRNYLYVADTGNRRVVRINLSTKIAQVVAGNGTCSTDVATSDGKPALEANLCSPTQVGLDPDGNLLVLDTEQNAVRRITFTTSTIGQLSFASTQQDNSSLVRKSDGSFVRTYRNGVVVVFDKNGNQLSSADRGNRKIVFAYDSVGRLVSQIDPTGAMIQYNYSGDHLSSILDPAGRITNFSFSGEQLVGVEYPDSTNRFFDYDAHDLMVSQTDQEGHLTSVEYNSFFRMKKIIDSLGNITTFQDSDSINSGNKNINGVVGNIQRAGTGSGDVNDKVIDANNNQTTFVKDDNGYVQTVVNADGKSTQYVRNISGQLLKIIKPDNSYRSFQYNINGDLVSEYDSAADITVKKEYDLYGNVISFTNAQGVKVTNGFDSQGLMISSASTEGDSVTQAYNVFGLVSQVTNSLGQKNQYEYDQHGNVIKITNNATDVNSLVRDGAGNVVQKVDAKGNKTTYQYDTFNRLISITSPKIEITSISYSPTGNILKVTDPKGNVQSFEYDAMGNMISKTDNNNLKTQLFYDGNKNIVKIIDEGGREKFFNYNASNKLVRKLLPDNTYNLSYDSSGNLAQISDNNTQIDYTYNSINQVKTVSSQGRGAAVDLPSTTLTYNYDIYGNKIELIDPTGTTTYQYDDTNVLIGLVNQRGESFNFNMDLNNKLTSITRPGSTTAIAYDNAEFLQSITHTTNAGSLSFYDYLRDPVGNKIVKRTPAGDSNYGYDTNDQLVSATNPDATTPFDQENFSYDELGNRTDNGFQYDAKKTKLIEDFKYLYSYDVYGNLTSKIEKPVANGNVVNYNYNSENMMIGVDTYKNNVLVSKAEYLYDAIGRRVQKKVVDNVDALNNKTRKYAYDGLEIILEYDENNDLLAKYTNSTRGIDDVLSVAVTSKGRDQGIAPTQGSYFFLKDALGSITDITNSSGSIIQKYGYSAFGKLLKVKDGNGADISANPLMQIMHTFTGREYDKETGLYFYRARYYDPEVGRFIQTDPHPGNLSNPLTYINKYIYVLNNPINATDPLGLWSLKKFISGAAKAVVNTAKKVMSNKVAGLIISTVVAGPIGALAYINMSGQFHPKDVAFVNMVAVTAAAAATGGAAGAAVGGLVGGGLAGAAVGAVAGAVVGGVTGGFVGGTLSSLGGGSFQDGFMRGAVQGAIAGGLAGAMRGYNAIPGKELAYNSNPYGPLDSGSGRFSGCAKGVGLILNAIQMFQIKVPIDNASDWLDFNDVNSMEDRVDAESMCVDLGLV